MLPLKNCVSNALFMFRGTFVSHLFTAVAAVSNNYICKQFVNSPTLNPLFMKIILSELK